VILRQRNGHLDDILVSVDEKVILKYPSRNFFGWFGLFEGSNELYDLKKCKNCFSG
jgi:hypothetical protein